MTAEKSIRASDQVSALELSMERGPARIKVVGVGGGGCNCVRRMMRHSVPGVQFVMVNTDIKSLEPVLEGAPGDPAAYPAGDDQASDITLDRLQIGEKVTHGWGAGGDSVIGSKSR